MTCRTVFDEANNRTTAGPVGPFKIDRKPPYLGRLRLAVLHPRLTGLTKSL